METIFPWSAAGDEKVLTLSRAGATLHVEIEDIKPSVSRRIVVDGDITLRSLHHVLQAALGWTDSHQHEFAI